MLDDNLIYSAVKKYEVEIEGYSADRIWINPSEVRLLSSLILSVQQRHGKVYAYPDVLPIRVDLNEERELTSDNTREYLKKRLIEGIDSRESDHNPLFYTPIPQPPYFSDHHYRYNDHAADVAHQIEIFESIDLNDDLLIRGLGALLKGDPLNTHQIFHTEACLSLYIAMEASMHLIYRRLEGRLDNPGPKDASQYLADQFNARVVPEGYFPEFWEDRIRTVHPNNKFGTFPYAPLSADDYFDLYDQLRSVYDFLITGRVDPAYEGR